MKPDKRKKIVSNRKARHDFDILEKFEAGLVLKGTEIKSIREGKSSFRDSFVDISEREAWLVGFYIAPYSGGNRFNHDPGRKRKLLLHKHEILKLERKSVEKGYTIVPLELYINSSGKAKMLIALAKGKARFDKRRSIKERDMERDIKRMGKKFGL